MAKEKLCRFCETPFEKLRPLQIVCSSACGIGFIRQKKQKAFNKQTRILKKGLKTKSGHLKDAQKVFNRFIRLRDHQEPCISCGRYHGGQYHAGHYKSVGAYPELRFEELNCHKQCSACNDGNKLSGNIHEYRKGLIRKIGIEQVEWLEGPHKAAYLSGDEITEIKVKYSRKARELEKI